MTSAIIAAQVKDAPTSLMQQGEADGALFLQIQGVVRPSAQTDLLIAQIFQNRSREIRLLINSPGGDWDVGLSIIDAIEQHGNVTGIVSGMAASMGSLIAVTCKRTYIKAGSRMMIHNGRITLSLNKEEMDDIASSSVRKMLDRADRTGATAYIKKTGKPESEIIEKMKREEWFTDEEAVAYGLVDGYASDVQMNAALSPLIPIQQVDLSTKRQPQAHKTMSFEIKMKSKLGHEGMSDEKAIEYAGELLKNNDALTAELSTQKKVTEKLEAKLKTLETAETERAKAAQMQALDTAVEAGKITQAERAEWEKDMAAAPEVTMRHLEKLPGNVDISAQLAAGTTARSKQELGGHAAPSAQFSAEQIKEFEGMSFRELEKKSPEYLTALELANPEKFKRLEDAAYGA